MSLTIAITSMFLCGVAGFVLAALLSASRDIKRAQTCLRCREETKKIYQKLFFLGEENVE